jgi:hypothetical protein
MHADAEMGASAGSSEPDCVIELDVRRADHDITVFVEKIVNVLLLDAAVLIDLSNYEDHGNRILLRVGKTEKEGRT